MVQEESFSNEIKCLNSGKPLNKHSQISALNPIIDSEGLIRFSSRLQKATHLSYDQRNPIILLSGHIISHLIVRDAHIQTLHGTQQQTLMYISQRFHIIRCKNLVRKVIFKCIPCYKQKCSTQNQLMASLPSSRVTPDRTFSNCGVDLAGPFEIKKWKGKCNKFYKSYFAIFVCFVTKAIHLSIFPLRNLYKRIEDSSLDEVYLVKCIVIAAKTL